MRSVLINMEGGRGGRREKGLLLAKWWEREQEGGRQSSHIAVKGRFALVKTNVRRIIHLIIS